MYAKNPIMLKDGFAPAASTARALNLSLSTIHRMVEDGRVEGTRVGRALYVKLPSLEDYFGSEGNEAMQKAVGKLRSELEKELKQKKAAAG